jgi:hypothetical protein
LAAILYNLDTSWTLDDNFMLGFVAIWTPYDVIGTLMMVFTLIALLDDDMWPLEAFSTPLRA